MGILWQLKWQYIEFISLSKWITDRLGSSLDNKYCLSFSNESIIVIHIIVCNYMRIGKKTVQIVTMRNESEYSRENVNDYSKNSFRQQDWSNRESPIGDDWFLILYSIWDMWKIFC